MALSIMWTSVSTRLLGYTANVFFNAFLKGLNVHILGMCKTLQCVVVVLHRYHLAK